MMPLLFVGHGTPMNAIEDNNYTRGMKEITSIIPKPDAILSISAHWVTNGTKVLTLENPETIHDFYGFPKALYEIEYKAKGCPELAKKTIKLLGKDVTEDRNWGFDHGTWCLLHVMYPEANIPTYQLSVNQQASPEEAFELGKKLRSLRDENVLILGSGNIVHNLGLVDFSIEDGYDWANDFDHFIKDKIVSKDYNGVINYMRVGDMARKSVPTTEHFNPLLYILGATTENDQVKIFNNSCVYGSLSMTSYLFL